MDVAAAHEPDARILGEQVLKQVRVLETDAIQPRQAELDRRVVHEQHGRPRSALVELSADPLDLIGPDPSAHRAGDVRVEAEAEPVPRLEGEVDPVGAVAGDPVGERGTQRRTVVVVAGERPEAVEEGLEELPHGRIGLGQLVVRVVAGHDDVVGTHARLLHVREHVLAGARASGCRTAARRGRRTGAGR